MRISYSFLIPQLVHKIAARQDSHSDSRKRGYKVRTARLPSSSFNPDGRARVRRKRPVGSPNNIFTTRNLPRRVESTDRKISLPPAHYRTCRAFSLSEPSVITSFFIVSQLLSSACGSEWEEMSRLHVTNDYVLELNNVYHAGQVSLYFCFHRNYYNNNKLVVLFFFPKKI